MLQIPMKFIDGKRCLFLVKSFRKTEDELSKKLSDFDIFLLVVSVPTVQSDLYFFGKTYGVPYFFIEFFVVFISCQIR